MNKYKKLISNSIVFAIGNFGSKIISLVMVPLYTYALSTEDYGHVDLVLTTLNLLLPIVSLCLSDAILRYVMEKNSDRGRLFSNVFIFEIIISVGIVVLLVVSLLIVKSNKEMLVLSSILLILQMFQSLYGQYTRGVEKVKQFAFNGILMTVLTASLNVLFLIVWNLGIYGYFMSLILANLCSIIYLELVTKGARSVKISYFSINEIKRLGLYSLPLVPNMVMWWVINDSTRFFILFFSGATVNGLYAVASKIPSVINMVSGIFGQAWQLSSIEEYDSKSKSTFYTKVFSIYSSVLVLVVCGLLSIIKIVFPMIVNFSYSEGWKLVPPLLMATLFSSLSGYVGSSYTAAMETKGILISSIFGGVLGLILNVMLIPFLGGIGAGISSALSFLAILIYRLIDTRKYVVISVNWYLACLNITLLMIQTTVTYLLDGKYAFMVGIFNISVLIFFNGKPIYSELKRKLTEVLNGKK